MLFRYVVKCFFHRRKHFRCFSQIFLAFIHDEKCTTAVLKIINLQNEDILGYTSLRISDEKLKGEVFNHNAYRKFYHLKSLGVYNGFLIRYGGSACIRLSCATMPKLYQTKKRLREEHHVFMSATGLIFQGVKPEALLHNRYRACFQN